MFKSSTVNWYAVFFGGGGRGVGGYTFVLYRTYTFVADMQFLLCLQNTTISFGHLVHTLSRSMVRHTEYAKSYISGMKTAYPSEKLRIH